MAKPPSKRKKPGTKSQASKGGRPRVITPLVLQKLREAYLLDATDEEASEYAGINAGTLYNYQREHPGFIEKKQGWKSSVTFKAKKKVAEAVETDADLALRLLERRQKEHYSTRTETEAKLEVKIMNDIEMDGVPLIFNIGERAARNVE